MSDRSLRPQFVWFVLVFFVAGAWAFAIEYVDGFLDVREDGERYELFMGDSATEESTIRLKEDSIAELFGAGVKLTLTKPGVYEVSNLIDVSAAQRSSGLASVVGGKLASLFTERKQESQAAVMGVRGSKSESDVQWMTGDTAELIESGREHLEASELEEAVSLFEEAYDFAEIDEETEVLFYLGYTHYALGNVRVASDYLREIFDVDTDAEFFPNLLLLNGQVLAETFAFEDAVEWLGRFGDLRELEPSVRQTGLLLTGVSHSGLDDSSSAREAFEASIAIDDSSDVGRIAAELLQGLES